MRFYTAILTSEKSKIRIAGHIFTRLCKDSGLGIKEVQGLVRYKSFKTTYDIYGKLDFEEIQKRYENKFLARF